MAAEQGRRHWVLEEYQRIAEADLQRAAELALRHRAEDEADDHRRDRIVPAAHQVPRDAEDHEQEQLVLEGFAATVPIAANTRMPA